MSLTPPAAPSTSAIARRGLWTVLTSTFFQLSGYFMLGPWLLLHLKDAALPTWLIGLFAATSWAGIFIITPFAATITQRLGRRPSLWLSGSVPMLAGVVFGSTDSLALWFAMQCLAGIASGLRWVLAESMMTEFAPTEQRGHWTGIFATMVGSTFIMGPILLAGLGAEHQLSLWMAVALMGLGWLGSFNIPALPTEEHAAQGDVGWRGLRQAVLAQPAIMLAGFVGGFFESGLSAILPLYGLSLGLSSSAAALLVSASGIGSSVLMWPTGKLADRLSRGQAQGFWGHPAQTRLRLMCLFAALTLLGSLLLPWVADTPALAWAVAFIWGGAGGSLYTLAMIDIGSRANGIQLVNSTAVLVLAYTLGGVLAPALGAAALEWSPAWGFPLLLWWVAGAGVWRLWRAMHR